MPRSRRSLLWLERAESLKIFRTLVFAGMDMTSSAPALILWLLSQHPDVREKLRGEIREAQKNGQLGYDQLASLPYLMQSGEKH
jgi:cytochrome P450